MSALLLGLLVGPSVALAATGSVEVKVQNAPGEVVLDGFPTGQNAPTLLESVPVGTHVVELEYGCMAGTLELTVEAGQTAVAAIPLKNRGGNGTLRLRGLPDNADVMIDGAPVDRADEGVELKCGSRRVQIEVPGYAPWEQMVVITTGKWTNTPVELVMEDITPEPPQPKAPTRPVDEDEDEDEREPYEDEEEEEEPPSRYSELDELDEPDEPPSSRRSSGREEEDEEETEEEDEPRSREADEDEPDFRDEDEPDFRDEDDRYDEEDDYGEDPDDYGDEDEDLDELDGRSSNPRAPKDSREAGPGVPVRGVAVGVSGAVGAAGMVVGFARTPTYLQKKENYEQLVILGSSMAEPWLRDELTPARKKMVQGYAVGGLGVAAAGLCYALIPGREAADLVVVPTPTGFTATWRF